MQPSLNCFSHVNYAMKNDLLHGDKKRIKEIHKYFMCIN